MAKYTIINESEASALSRLKSSSDVRKVYENVKKRLHGPSKRAAKRILKAAARAK